MFYCADEKHTSKFSSSLSCCEKCKSAKRKIKQIVFTAPKDSTSPSLSAWTLSCLRSRHPNLALHVDALKRFLKGCDEQETFLRANRPVLCMAARCGFIDNDTQEVYFLFQQMRETSLGASLLKMYADVNKRLFQKFTSVFPEVCAKGCGLIAPVEDFHRPVTWTCSHGEIRTDESHYQLFNCPAYKRTCGKCKQEVLIKLTAEYGNPYYLCRKCDDFLEASEIVTLVKFCPRCGKKRTSYYDKISGSYIWNCCGQDIQ